MKEYTIPSGKRPKNPLAKRVWKDIWRDRKRYLMIFTMLVVTIGFVSGMYVANNSMMQTLENNVEALRCENGHFELSAAADEELIKAIETGERADMVKVFREHAYDEAEEKITETVDEAVREKVEGQVEAAIKSQTEQAVSAELAKLGAAAELIPEEQKAHTLAEAIDKAMAENYGSAVEKAYEEAKKSDEYKTALSDAMEKAKKEIDKKIDEEFEELNERYKLDDEDFKPVPVTVYELFCRESDEYLGSTHTGNIRVYGERKDVDLYDILEGRAPENDSEIIIDRMHADNAGIKIGDTLTVGKADFKVVGLAAFVDYSTLYESNYDTMFDALTFDVAMVTNEGFKRLGGIAHYFYAFTYGSRPADEFEEKELSDNFLVSLITQTAVSEKKLEIKDYVPAYLNHAITFAPDDMGSDKAMGGVLLYILTAVLAFIFAVTISGTLEKESTVIGTLRASGYTKGELLRYYMSAPVVVVLLAAIVGNILGYTVMKRVVVAMYYNSYSLPTYKTIWTPEAFVRTTIIPVILMLVINLVIISKTLRLSPLRFLRRDLKKRRRKKAVRLPRWKFFRRFRMRVLLQNATNYLMLFVGICFIMLLLSMAVGMPATLKYYQDSVENMMFAKDQIILSATEDEDGNEITTSTPGAERFSVTSLERRSDAYDEEVTVYGVNENSRYIALSDDYFSESGSGELSVYVSKAYSEKYGVHEGDVITLSEKYENKAYNWKVYGIHDYSAGVAVFMSNDRFNETFDRNEGSFGGYMSDEMITDIDEDYIAKEITADDMTKLTRQLDHSMGSYMLYFQYVCVIVAAIIIYLLTKLIIEKNEVSISMVKILGYTDGELASLYLVTTGIVVLLSELAAMYIGFKVMGIFWKEIMMTLGGWFDFVMTPDGFVKEFVLVLAAYVLIAAVDFIRIKRIPKILALKNTE